MRIYTLIFGFKGLRVAQGTSNGETLSTVCIMAHSAMNTLQLLGLKYTCTYSCTLMVSISHTEIAKTKITHNFSLPEVLYLKQGKEPQK